MFHFLPLATNSLVRLYLRSMRCRKVTLDSIKLNIELHFMKNMSRKKRGAGRRCVVSIAKEMKLA